MGTVRLHARSSGPSLTISALALRLDAQRYVCPAALARRLDRLLDPAGASVVLTLTGSGGTGKSAALREAGRRAESAGWTVIELDGRRADFADAAARLPDLPGGPAVVLVDGADELGAGLQAFGRTVAELPASTRVAVAGRRLPARWLPDHLEPLSVAHRLAPLGSADAEEVLRRHDVDDPAARGLIRGWAEGLPLALVLGAAAWGSSAPTEAGTLPVLLARETEGDLIERLSGAALDDLDPELVALVALAGGVDATLVEALMPETDASTVLAHLRASALAEPVGGRVALQARLGDAVVTRLRREDRGRAESITLRVAGHLRDRAVLGEAKALPWLAGLVQDPALRAGLAPAVSADLYADRARPEDAPRIRDVLDRRWPGAWSVVAPWLRTGAAHVVRDAGGLPVAAVAVLPLARAGTLDPACARQVAPLVEHARAHRLDDHAVLTPFQVVLCDDDPDPEVLRVRNAVALQQCGLANPHRDLVLEITGSAREEAVLAAYGYEEIPGLARSFGGVTVRAWCADAGPRGLAGLLYDAVAAEQGQPAVAAPAGGAVLLQALDDLHCDATLAALPVAPAGLTQDRAAERVRAWVREAVDQRLGDEPELHDVVTRRYLTPGATHASVMGALFASRATYFRRLRRARALLVGADVTG